jgi:hypothetical protein
MDETASRPTWQHPAHGLSRKNLQSLIAGEVPIVLMGGFATVDECAAFFGAILRHADQAKDAETARMTLIGVNFSNYGGENKAGYFDLVDPSYEALRPILAEAGFDPLARMVEQLRAIWSAEVDVADESGFGRYFAGGIKMRTSSGHLHYDFAPHTADGFVIAGINDQLGWNLYLDMPESTGETTVYRRPVPREGGKVGTGSARALNLEQAYVDGAEAFTFEPRVGDVAIINTRYPHKIAVDNAGPDEWRAQTSSFIGRLPDDRLILWS